MSVNTTKRIPANDEKSTLVRQPTAQRDDSTNAIQMLCMHSEIIAMPVRDGWLDIYRRKSSSLAREVSGESGETQT